MSALIARHPAPEESDELSIPLSLQCLLDELLIEAARHALAADLPDAMRLAQTCRGLRRTLAPVTAEAAARRLRWQREYTAVHEIDGLTLTAVDQDPDARAEPWAAGSLLATVGRTSWAVRIELSERNDGFGVPSAAPLRRLLVLRRASLPSARAACCAVRFSSPDARLRFALIVRRQMIIGICDKRTRCGWGLNLFNGKLIRRTMHYPRAAPLDGYPDGARTQVLWSRSSAEQTDGADGEDEPANLQGRANGAVIEVRVDHDAGSLAFGIDGGEDFLAVDGFPKGAAMRPFVKLNNGHDRIRLVRPFFDVL